MYGCCVGYPASIDGCGAGKCVVVVDSDAVTTVVGGGIVWTITPVNNGRVSYRSDRRENTAKFSITNNFCNFQYIN